MLFCLVAARAQTPVVADGGVANAATMERGTGVAPGAMVTIFGSSLASGLARQDSVPLSGSIGDVSVTFNGVAAPLQFVAENMIGAQVPWNVVADATAGGSVNVVVTRAGNASQAVSVPIVPFSPAIYRVHPYTTQAMALNADGTLTAAPNTVEGMQSHPATVGDTVLIYANGLGAVTPAASNGSSSQDVTRIAVTTPTVLIQGVAAQVTFAGHSPKVPGLNLLNVIVQPGITSSDASPLQIQVGGITTTNAITIAVRVQ